jgi:alkanesulfonate monooxygenase SsuD/methylene tetrahydromethanopterin reductase-like flavin-dependent oxidoreductase (luciferase family)
VAEVRVGTLGSPAMLRGDLEKRRTLAARVIESGLDHVFVADHVSFHTGEGMDGLVNAATLAALHPTLEVHVGVYLLALRHPVLVARQLASLCESAPGRVVFGVGVGGEDRHEIEICGVDPATRGRRTDESLSLLRRLLAGEAVTHRGEFFALDAARVLPAPHPAVPILIGGRSEAALRRVGGLGDGWLAAWCSPRRYAESLARVAAHADAAGRGDVAWRHGLQLWTAYDRKPEAARERLARAMEGMYRIPFERFERYSPYGSPEAVARSLVPYVEAGCTSFNIMPVCESEEAGIDAVAEVRERLRAA